MGHSGSIDPRKNDPTSFDGRCLPEVGEGLITDEARLELACRAIHVVDDQRQAIGLARHAPATHRERVDERGLEMRVVEQRLETVLS